MEKIEIDSKTFDAYSSPTANASLLIIRGSRGMLACGYISVETANKIGDVAAIVTGVKDFNDMLEKNVVAASNAAIALGIKPGMTGKETLVTFLS